MIQPKSLGAAVLEALKFPISKNLLIYNLIIVAVSAVMFLLIAPPFINKTVEIQKQMQEIQQHPAASTTNDISTDNRSLQEISEEMKALSQKPNLTDEDKALITKDMQAAMEKNPLLSQYTHKNQNNPQYAQLQDLQRQLRRLFPMLFLIITLFYVAIIIRNLDITCQIGTGNFVGSELHPMRYSKPLLWLKLFGFLTLLWLILSIGLCIVFVILFFILPHFIALLLFLILYIAILLIMPAISLTLVNNYSIFASLAPNKWIETLNKIGTKNYFSVLGIMVLIMIGASIPNAITNALMTHTTSALATLPFFIISIYIQLHVMNSFSYIYGYLIYDKKEEFEMLGASDLAVEDLHKTPIQEAEELSQSGHIKEAIETLKIAINNETDFSEKLQEFKLLINLSKKQGDSELVEATQQRMIQTVIKDYPSYINQITSLLMEKIQDKTFIPQADMIYPLAQSAYDARRINDVFALCANFAKNNPNHKDIVPIYLLVGKSLCHAKQYDKAYTLISGLYSKYQNHPQANLIKDLLEKIERNKSV